MKKFYCFQARTLALGLLGLALAGCDDDDVVGVDAAAAATDAPVASDAAPPDASVAVSDAGLVPSDGPSNADAGGGALYSLGSVVLQPDNPNERKTYIQTIRSLDFTSIDNKNAIEIPGNGTHMAWGGHVYVGLAEEPSIVRYTPDVDGVLHEDGRVSFLNYGWQSAPFGNAIVSADRAYAIDSYLAVVWNPATMEIVTTIDLSALKKDAFSPEFWTTIARDGRVYIPVRYADWKMGAIDKSVTLVIVDVATNQVLGVAKDQRCASGGRPAFTPDGDLYVVADGRDYSAQMYAIAAGQPPPTNCILRIKKGELSFDPNYLVEVPSLTGGHDVATELEPGAEGTGVVFAKMFYPEKLPPGVTIATDFKFWGTPSFLYWRIELGATPRAAPVTGLSYSALSFSGETFEGKLYVGEGDDYVAQTVFELDPATGQATKKFTMQGNFYGLHRLR